MPQVDDERQKQHKFNCRNLTDGHSNRISQVVGVARRIAISGKYICCYIYDPFSYHVSDNIFFIDMKNIAHGRTREIR